MEKYTFLSEVNTQPTLLVLMRIGVLVIRGQLYCTKTSKGPETFRTFGVMDPLECHVTFRGSCDLQRVM